MSHCSNPTCNHLNCLSVECNHASCSLKNDYRTFDCIRFVTNLRAKHTTRIPVCVMDHTQENSHTAVLHRFLVDMNASVLGFLTMIRKRIADLNPVQSVYILTLNDEILPTSVLMSEVKSYTANGLLVLYLYSENVFGV